MTHTANLVIKPNDIIATTLFGMDTFNVALSFVTDGRRANIDSKITKAADNVGTMYSTMVYKYKYGDIPIDHIIQDLGEYHCFQISVVCLVF